VHGATARLRPGTEFLSSNCILNQFLAKCKRMAKIIQKVVVLGTGGTIAGTAASSADHTGYTAAQIGVQQLLGGITGLSEALQGAELVAEQVAQIDSKNMDFATMALLTQRCAHWLGQGNVAGIVITHGTDTLEETAWFLHLALPAALLAAKPVVLTCAMRPATSSEADGPRNVCDAVRVALHLEARGVLCACAGDVHSAQRVQKVHTHALNAFSSGDAGPVAVVQGAQVRLIPPTGLNLLPNRPLVPVALTQAAIENIATRLTAIQTWPRVEIVFNHAHSSGSIVRALLADPATAADPLRGIVVAGTGNGTMSAALQAALQTAQSQGVQVLRASRCAWGGVSATAHDVFPCTELSAVKARVQMVLQLALAA
jgi:L-asparaginase